MSRAIHVKHSLASQGICTLAPEGSMPGHRGNIIVIRVLDVPDEVSDAEAVRLVNATVFYPPRFLLRFRELGDGKIVTGRQLSTEEAASRYGQGVSDARMRQLIASGHVPAQRVGRDWRIHEGDLALVEPREPGRAPTKTVCACCQEPCAGRTWKGRNVHLHKGQKICGWCAKKLKTQAQDHPPQD